MVAKKATQKFMSLSLGKLTGTQQGIVNDLKKKYILHDSGQDGSREKHMLVMRSGQRLVANEQVSVTPPKKRPHA